MADGHPHEHDLLAYVEDDLLRSARDAVSLHLETCAECRQAVADAQAGRALLQAAPPLELSSARRDAIAASLGPAEPRRSRRPAWRLVAVLAATLAVAGLLGVALNRVGSGTDDSGGREAAATAGAEDQAEGGGEFAPAVPGATLLGQVAGTPASVAAGLREDGFDATVENGVVLVQVDAAKRDELERAVAGLDRGPVAVYVK
jgi:anti-sigma factor RsiW